MEKRSLPLNFYCRSARLLLKKATFSRKSNLLAEELRHLKKFSTLAFSVIPSHPEYEDEKGRKLAEDLEDYMADVRERIEELEEELTSTSSLAGYRKSGSFNRKELVARHEKNVGKRQHVWARFVRKLYDAAPCFSARLKKRPPQPLAGQLSGSRSSKESSSRFLYNVAEVASLSSDGQVSDDMQDDERVPDRSLKITASNEITLDIRRKVERHDTTSLDTESTTRTQLMQQIAEATNLSLEGRFLNLQTIVMQLRDSMEGLRSRVEEEGKRWRGRAETLERKLKLMKDETENDFSGLKRQVEEDMKKACGVSGEDQELRKKANVKQKFEDMMQTSSGEVEEFRTQVNQFVTQTQKMLTLGLEERFLDSLSEVRTDLKNDISNLEIGFSKDVDNLRQEMASRYESMLIDVEMGRIGGQQQINTLKKQRFENGAQAAPAPNDVTKQVDALRADVTSLHRDFERLCDDQKFEKLQLRKRLQCSKQEVMEARVDTEVWIKECEVQVKEFRHDLIELRGEQEEMKVDVEVLKRQQSEREYPRRRSFDEKYEGSGTGLPVEFASNLLMVEKVEKFSKLYTGCLEDLRTRLCRIESAQDCIGDLQTRVYRLEAAEQTLSTTPGDTMALIERERSLATSAATDAIAAASRTKEMLEETFGTFLSQIVSAKEKAGGRDVVELSGDEPKQERHLKTTVQRLNRQMKEVFERLTSVSCGKTPGGGKKLSKAGTKKELKSSSEVFMPSVTSIENKIKAAAGIMSQMNDRIHRLETVQQGLSRSIDDARKGNQALRKAANFWLPRYEATAKLVMEISGRLASIEQRKPLTDMMDPSSEQQKAAGNTTKPGLGMEATDRLLALESRMDHIASATYANLRLLDAKVEHASIGMRSALDIATETEDKCSSLGGELVKVFRLILTARESPTTRKPDSPPLCPPERGPQERAKSPGGARSPPPPAARSPAPAKSPESRNRTQTQQLYNPLPAKPVKRISLKFGDQGNIFTNAPR
ncbi:rootletin [Selaginella moellendorffii]|uniref:rootletin n=1 Tax=Selaginella moellendorffii TaxID=88036 RepID=UPI000D1CE275|nr:rootletin [Selaginella moellendorffii]|eukprot:XP_024536959.1 rootletin [Selaginella moellendorffii]